MMNSHYTYFLILLLSLAGPLLLSFDKKVQFFRKWKFVFPAMVFPAILYIAWDSWFTISGIWNFNEKYITGIKFLHLPVEEIAFFFVIPYCCLFIYECVRCYFPKLQSNKIADGILLMTAFVLLLTGIICYTKLYTVITFTFCSLFIISIILLRGFFHTNSSLIIISWLLILLPFMIVNGFLTALPVVIYNDEENMAMRIFTIPAEDIFYGMILMLMNVSWYERLRHKKNHQLC